MSRIDANRAPRCNSRGRCHAQLRRKTCGAYKQSGDEEQVGLHAGIGMPGRASTLPKLPPHTTRLQQLRQVGVLAAAALQVLPSLAVLGNLWQVQWTQGGEQVRAAITVTRASPALRSCCWDHVCTSQQLNHGARQTTNLPQCMTNEQLEKRRCKRCCPPQPCRRSALTHILVVQAQ